MQMTADLTAALVLLLAAGAFGMVSNLLFYAMIGEINGRRPREQRISYLFFSLSKCTRILREYRRSYPTGRLAFYCETTGALGLVLVVAAAWQFGFFGALLHAMSHGGSR